MELNVLQACTPQIQVMATDARWYTLQCYQSTHSFVCITYRQELCRSNFYIPGALDFVFLWFLMLLFLLH